MKNQEPAFEKLYFPQLDSFMRFRVSFRTFATPSFFRGISKHIQLKSQGGLSVLLCPHFGHFSLLPLLSPLQCIIAVWLASTSTPGSFKKPHLLPPSASRHWAGLWKVLRVLASGVQIHVCVYRILTNSFLLPCFLGCVADCEHYI